METNRTKKNGLYQRFDAFGRQHLLQLVLCGSNTGQVPNGLPKCPANQKFNNCLKEIGKMMPELNQDFEKTLTRGRKAEATIYKKWELLQTHTARRSFCTNEYLAGTPTITIMAISGHKTDKSFMAYIKADSLKHAMVMRDRWNMKNQ